MSHSEHPKPQALQAVVFPLICKVNPGKHLKHKDSLSPEQEKQFGGHG
jgi:hypothetical protein